LIEQIIAATGGCASIAGFMRTLSQWDGKFADYVAAATAVVLSMLVAWAWFGGRISAALRNRSLYTQLAAAAKDAQLSNEEVKHLANSLRVGGRNPMLSARISRPHLAQ